LGRPTRLGRLPPKSPVALANCHRYLSGDASPEPMWELLFPCDLEVVSVVGSYE
jgi:hypothetical protein